MISIIEFDRIFPVKPRIVKINKNPEDHKIIDEHASFVIQIYLSVLELGLVFLPPSHVSETLIENRGKNLRQ